MNKHAKCLLNKTLVDYIYSYGLKGVYIWLIELNSKPECEDFNCETLTELIEKFNRINKTPGDYHPIMPIQPPTRLYRNGVFVKPKPLKTGIMPG